MPKDFSRDLGYLDKFLQGLRAHAATLGEPAGSRLAALLNEQDRAWTEIRGILAGNPGTSATAPAASEPKASQEPEARGERAPAPESSAKRLTVGSLIS